VFEGVLKRKYAAILICLLLFVAAVDTIPDPLAVSPPSSHSCGISPGHIRGSLNLFEKQWSVAAGSFRRDSVNCIAFRLTFDARPVGTCPLPLVYHATDASPPVIS
jgi:hypothetical protein